MISAVPVGPLIALVSTVPGVNHGLTPERLST